MARRKRRNRGRGESSVALIIGTVFLGCLSLALVCGYAWLKYRASTSVPIDQASLCPQSGPTSDTAILLDVTDAISDTTELDLKNQFRKIVAAIPIGGAIDVYALTQNEGVLQHTFHGCNPGSGESADPWTTNPRQIEDRWEKGFQKPLDDIAGKIGTGAGGNQSPIMAGIQKINLEAFAQLPAAASKQLIVASDMVEHTNSFSNYRDGVSYEKFLKSPARDLFRTNLEGVTVRILAFQRPNMKFDMADLAEFWAQWIKNNNGNFDSFVRLEGKR